MGHRNGATIKGVNFFGPNSEYIVSGSDCGNVFFWDRNTEAIVQWFLADDNGVVSNVCVLCNIDVKFIRIGELSGTSPSSAIPLHKRLGLGHQSVGTLVRKRALTQRPDRRGYRKCKWQIAVYTTHK